MSTFLDELLKKMKTAPHVGVPPVTNQKVPTKVEKDTATFASRQKDMPSFTFGTGTPLEKLKSRMVSTPHPTPTFADPSFNPHSGSPISKADFDAYAKIYKEFLKQVEQEEGQKEVTMQVR